ncbi:ATP-binding cassette domain-containing protein, partial [Bdellovibrionota bacterium FG-2]
MAIFEAEHLTFSYMIEGAHFPVLRDVNLNVQAGEVVAIQGPSGSGKSTLLYILGGLLAPDQGRVLFEGVNLYSRSKDALALLRNQTLGFVFQQFHLLPKSSVLDNILLPARYPCEVAKVGAEDREKAIGLAVKLGLGEHLERRPNQLSGGQQQRVAIARALMRDARLILADEPTGNLDTATAAQIMDLLKELARQGKAVVIITHDSEIAAQCERVYHIRDGAVVKHERNSGVETEERGGVGEVGSRLRWSFFSEYLRIARLVAPLAWANLRTHKLRSALTMMGITIGISSVLAMVTLGQFTKTKILQSYEDLGVNKLMFRGFRNWMLKATDSVPVLFRWFDYDRDLSPLKRIFPQIKLWSPILDAWNNEVSFGGRTTSRVMVYGVSPDYLAITNREVVLGRGFSPYHIEN